MDSLTHTRKRSSSGLVRLLIAAFMALLLGTYIVLPALAAGSGTWTLTGSLHVAREQQTATLLQNGQVLVAGGYGSDGSPVASSELFNPATGTWTTTGSMNFARANFTATLLQNGQVLVAGGDNDGFGTILASAELFNPATGTWTLTGSMSTTRFAYTATLLSNGRVLVAGGASISSSGLASAELFNPATGTWTTTGSMNVARTGHTMTLLTNGQVLVAGGEANSSATSTQARAELFNPATGAWTTTGSMHTARYLHAAALLSNGQVLVAGGLTPVGTNGDVTAVASAELFNPVTGTWSTTGSLNNGRRAHTATLLTNGQVLAAGGVGCSLICNSAELYTP